jgi:peptide/nickel transport system permease protein
MDEQKLAPNTTGQAPLKKNIALDDERRVKVLSPGMLVFKRFVRNRLAIVGSVIIIAMFLFSFLGGILMPYKESQVFKAYYPMVKDYAAVSENEEYRYVVPAGKTFNSSAKSKMIWAINNNENTFSSGSATYSLEKEGKDFYRITSTEMVASGKGIKNKFTLTPSSGVTLPADFTDKFNAAVSQKAATFTTDDGSSYLVKTTKIEAKVFEQTDLALASKLIFTGSLSEDYLFRLDAERALQSGMAATFKAGGETYTVDFSERGTAIFKNAAGEEIATASHFVIKAAQVGTVYPKGFEETVEDSILEGRTSFTLKMEDGAEKVYTINRNVKEYIVCTEQSTYQIVMYEYPTWKHLLGTDGNGMDVLTRLMYGGRVSLVIGFIVVLLETVLGVVLGGISGYFGKWIDNLLMRLVDIFNCIPTYPIFIIVGAIMDSLKVESTQRIFFLMIIMGTLGWPGIARIVRGQILSLREQEFMTAAEATGISVKRRIFRHLVPNVIPQLIVIDTMSLGSIILTEATLSFLGLGVKYPLASWGSIISAVSNVYVMTNFWFVWIPAGMLILITVLGFNFIGDGLRDAFDPKMKR